MLDLVHQQNEQTSNMYKVKQTRLTREARYYSVCDELSSTYDPIVP